MLHWGHKKNKRRSYMIPEHKASSNVKGKPQCILRKRTDVSGHQQKYPRTATKDTAANGQKGLIATRLVPLDKLTFDERPLDHTEKSNQLLKSMIEAINRKGLVKPVTVADTPKGMILLDGRRRVLACRQLGRESIMARVYALDSDEEVSAIRIIANSFHEELKPLDRANLIYRHFLVRHPNRQLRDIISSLITHQRHPERTEADFAATVDAVVTLSGVKISTIRNALGLLALPQQIQEAVRHGEIQQSKAYLLAKFYDREDLLDIFRTAVEQKLSKSAMKQLLKKEANPDEARWIHYRQMLGKFRVSIEKEVISMDRKDRDSLIAELRDLIAIISDPNCSIPDANLTKA
jgi:ParB-like chromosome segregation protein Spo0J